MPLLNGIDATQQIVRRVPETRVLMLSMHADEAYVMRALQAGATGYMVKDSAGKESVEGDRRRSPRAGRSSVPAIARLMLDDYVRTRGVRLRRSLRHAVGAGTRDLSADRRGEEQQGSRGLLDISPATVETHRARILQKLDIHSIAEVVLYAARRGIIS